MGTGVKQAGFTVIEVMLFLAVSAGLSAAVFATSMLNINQQRYTDAVRSFKALVQEQYVNTTRVQNPNSDNSQCPSSGSAQERGTNDCLVVGKLFSVTESKSIVIRNIVGVPPAEEKYTGTDLEAIEDMSSLYAVNAGAEALAPGWDTSLLARLANQFPGVSTFSLAIVRSPATGTPYTFFIPDQAFPPTDDESVGESIAAFILDDVSTYVLDDTRNLIICVEPQGLTALQQQITIDGKISGPSGIGQEDSTGC